MDIRTEVGLIRKHYREYTRNVGESIIYYEFIPFGQSASAGSFFDDVYDESISGSGGRRYKNGVVIPTLMITETEDQKRSIPEGRQPVEVSNFVCSLEDLRDAGVSDPFEYRKHLNDMFQYDGRYFTVTSYKVRGRAKDDIMVTVEGLEVYFNEEYAFDPDLVFTSVANLPWPSTFGKV